MANDSIIVIKVGIVILSLRNSFTNRAVMNGENDQNTLFTARGNDRIIILHEIKLIWYAIAPTKIVGTLDRVTLLHKFSPLHHVSTVVTTIITMFMIIARSTVGTCTLTSNSFEVTIFEA